MKDRTFSHSSFILHRSSFIPYPSSLLKILAESAPLIILNLWVAPDATARSLRQLTYGSFKYEGIDGMGWTPDGRIVYTAFLNTSSDVWIMNADGTGQKQLTSSQGSYYNGQPAASPDGRWVIYVAYDGEHLDLFKVAIDGGTPVRLTEGFLIDTVAAYSVNSPAVSPDGKLIAVGYRERAGAPLKLALLAIDGGRPSKLFDFPQTGSPLHWLPDGRALAYIDTQKGVSNIWALPIDGSKPKQLTDFTLGQISAFDLARDGKPTLFARGMTNRDVVLITGFR
jgi:Tol biopolymer transport system component